MQNQYIPGACNIGIEEIEKRKQMGWAGLICTVILYGLFVYFKVPQVWRIAVFIPAFTAAIGFIQAYMHFCAYFGLASLYNFGEVGKTDTVEQTEFRAKDRRKALQIIIYSIIAGVTLSVLAYILQV